MSTKVARKIEILAIRESITILLADGIPRPSVEIGRLLGEIPFIIGIQCNVLRNMGVINSILKIGINYNITPYWVIIADRSPSYNAVTAVVDRDANAVRYFDLFTEDDKKWWNGIRSNSVNNNREKIRELALRTGI